LAYISWYQPCRIRIYRITLTMQCNAVLVMLLGCWQTAAVSQEMSCEAPAADAKEMSLLQTAKAASINNWNPNPNLVEERQDHAAEMLSASPHKVRKLADDPSVIGPVDFVYCWAGESTQLDNSGAENDPLDDSTSGDTLKKFHVHGFGYNEMDISLQALHRYAPWFNKAYLLVDGPAELPSWAAHYPRVQMIDRCKLFPSTLDCPTKNTAACQSVAHLVPGLAEHFVYMDDDYIFVNDVVPTDLFSDDGKPRQTVPVIASELHRMYGQQEMLHGPNMPPVNVPETWISQNEMIKVHQPIPMTRNFSYFLELQYPEWYPFVRSHKKRFTCCDESLDENGCVEIFHNMYPAQLYKYGVGMPPKLFSHTVVCDCGWKDCVQDALTRGDEADGKENWAGYEVSNSYREPTKVVIIQNCYDAPTFRAARDVFLRHIAGTPTNVSSAT